MPLLTIKISSQRRGIYIVITIVMNNSFTHCPISNAVTSHPLVQQHSFDQVVVYKYPSYQWDHAVTLSVERREEGRRGEEREREREER